LLAADIGDTYSGLRTRPARNGTSAASTGSSLLSPTPQVGCLAPRTRAGAHHTTANRRPQAAEEDSVARRPLAGSGRGPHLAGGVVGGETKSSRLGATQQRSLRKRAVTATKQQITKGPYCLAATVAPRGSDTPGNWEWCKPCLTTGITAALCALARDGGERTARDET
jgi:hypothetical protein